MRFLAGLIASALLVASPAAHATELWQSAEAGQSEAEILARFDNAARPADPDSLDDDTNGRDDANWMKHTVAWFDGWGGGSGGSGKGDIRIDYRPVHEYTLTDDIGYIKPKKRVY